MIIDNKNSRREKTAYELYLESDCICISNSIELK